MRLEPTANFSLDLLHWCRLYLNDRLNKMGKAKVSELFDETEISKGIEGSTSIEDLVNKANAATRMGLKSMGSYVAAIKEFYDFTIQLNLSSMKEINQEVYQKYLQTESMLQRGKGTQQNYSLAIVGMFKFIELNNSDNVLFGLHHDTSRYNVRNKNEVPEHLTPEQFRTFSAYLAESFEADSYESTRNTLIALLLLYSGMKTDELASLKRGDVIMDAEENPFFTVAIAGTYPTGRTIPVPSSPVLRCLKGYLAFFNGSAEDYLFSATSNKNNKINQTTVASTIASLLNDSGIRLQKPSPKVLRHSYAMYLLSKRVYLKNIQLLLGLENLAMVATYAEALFDENIQIHEYF